LRVALRVGQGRSATDGRVTVERCCGSPSAQVAENPKCNSACSHLYALDKSSQCSIILLKPTQR
jgi:hypothetical protein